ncbi:hypothetical protein QQ045_020223 [Rhodiola kirilowii]
MMKNEKEEEKEEEEEAAVKVWDCGSPLYDSYELAALGHVIDRHTMALPSPCGSFRFSFSFRVEKRIKTASFQELSGVCMRKKVGSGGKEKLKKKKNGLFGLRHVRLFFGPRSIRPI